MALYDSAISRKTCTVTVLKKEAHSPLDFEEFLGTVESFCGF